ncbi:hypothetical protein [Planctomycetes bacterium K23_9]|uniref:Uncharacterized protein n=1 Tax=Stieleria marina TaxID=1930275 RepID=A0A517NW42_9BACT|nr:hypothetical protein K239x_33130 [Planctomycetes bacterium K23_9]
MTDDKPQSDDDSEEGETLFKRPENKPEWDCTSKCPTCGKECVREHNTAQKHKCSDDHTWYRW